MSRCNSCNTQNANEATKMKRGAQGLPPTALINETFRKLLQTKKSEHVAKNICNVPLKVFLLSCSTCGNVETPKKIENTVRHT